MHTHLALLPALLAAAALAPPAEAPRRVPAEGTRLTRVFRSEMELVSKSFRLLIDGTELPGEDLGGLELRLDEHFEMRVTDAVLALESGRVSRLRRRFDTIDARIHQRVSDAGEEQQQRQISPLAGRTVLFARAADGSWEARFEAAEQGGGKDGGKAGGKAGGRDGGSGGNQQGARPAEASGPDDEQLLAGLAPEMDLAVFLPREEAAEDESWELEPSTFAAVLFPGGELRLAAEGETDSGELDRKLARSLAGKARATWRGVREARGRKLGIVELEAELRMHGDELDSDGMAVQVAVGFELQGELLWDLERGHAHSASLTGPVQMQLSLSREMDSGEGLHELRQEAELEGRMTFNLALGS